MAVALAVVQWNPRLPLRVELTLRLPKMAEDLRSRRRWFRFSLRTMLVVVLLLSLPLSWFAVRLRKAERQRATLAKLDSMDAVTYEYDWQCPTYATSGPSRPPQLQWLIDLLGGDFFWDVRKVSYAPEAPEQSLELVAGFRKLKWLTVYRTVTDKGLRHIEKLHELKSLLIWNNNATDDGLAYLSGLHKLETLALSGGSQITSDGLANLSNLTELRDLNLTETLVDDQGLKHLRSMTKLCVLYLTGTRISGEGLVQLRNMRQLACLWLNQTDLNDAGMAHIQSLTSLRRLVLERTDVTDDGMQYLTGLVHLDRLDIESTEVSDRGLACLAKLDSLAVLNLAGNDITDAGLRHLAGLKNLRVLNIERTSITDAGLEHLLGLGLTDLSLGDGDYMEWIVDNMGKADGEKGGIRPCQVTADGVRRIREAFPHCTIRYEVHAPESPSPHPFMPLGEPGGNPFAEPASDDPFAEERDRQ